MEEIEKKEELKLSQEFKTCGRCGEYYHDCECPNGPLKD